MDQNNFILTQTHVKENQVKAVLNLVENGATISFIARYRKEMTQGLDEVQIENIIKFSKKFEQLSTRKQSILKEISAQNKLTDALKLKIENCFDAIKLEDYYLPFKQKRATKTEQAKKAGLISLAKIIMKQDNGDPTHMAGRFISTAYPNEELAIDGAKLIMAEWMNENEIVREKLRDSFFNFSIIKSKLVKGKTDETGKYKNFYDSNQNLKNCPSYRLLALLRGEKEGILKIKISPSSDYSLQWLERFYVKGNNASSDIVKIVIKDAFKRLIQPQLETETRAYYKNIADDKSIKTFSQNLKNILLAPPIGAKQILAIDPGFRTGCKIVCLDKSGKLLHNETVYPHAPKNEKSKASSKISQLVELYKIEAIAIGDGTAGRESEQWIKHIRFNRNLEVYIVREDGASIYSASKIAREEFPDYDVTVRGSVSIGRRLSDPLAELVKIDPKSLGVGQYQHDVNQLKLKQALDFEVETAVNQVGVNLNTASKYLLAYVSGLGQKTAELIIKYREENGIFKSREELKKVPRLGAKAFEQAAGFLRIKHSENPLDNSAVHPEQYGLVKEMAKKYKILTKDLIGNVSILSEISTDQSIKDKVDIYTLTDIIKELKKPGIDPRKSVKVLEFAPDLKTINDLKVGAKVNGIVTNVTDFGAFVNIGIKHNGLIHKTELSDDFVDDPTDFISVDEHIQATVIQVDLERNRIGLSLKHK